MTVINAQRFRLAFGMTFALLYIGCALLMLIAGREASIFFFNSIIHAIDVNSIIKTDMPLSEMLLGIIEMFILGWLTGATIAGIYNFRLKKEAKND